MAGDATPRNTPFWQPALAGPHQEVWYLKFNDPAAGRALWLRFTLLLRADGSKRLAETWAIAFTRENEAVAKVAVKNTLPIDAFATLPGADGAFRIGDCTFSDTGTTGEILSGENVVRWDLRFAQDHRAAFDFVPPLLKTLGIVKNTAWTVFEDLRFEGWSEVNGERFNWSGAPGMQGHLAGAKLGHSWVWGHCNTFVDEQGRPAGMIWDGLTGRARLGQSASTPAMTGMYIRYDGVDYPVKGVWSALRAPSAHTATDWRFTARHGDLAFLGHVTARPEDFAGVTYEDTDGSFLYCYNSKVSGMTLEARRNGQREALFEAVDTVAFEVVTREQRPGVPLHL